MTALAYADTAYRPWAATRHTAFAGVEARVVHKLTQKAAAPRLSASAEKTTLLNDLYELASEEGIDLQRSRVFNLAKSFILAIPPEMGTPELAMDNDGDIVFEWFGKWGAMLTLALRHDGRIAYAVRFSGCDKEHGTKTYLGEVPTRILELASKVTRGQ